MRDAVTDAVVKRGHGMGGDVRRVCVVGAGPAGVSCAYQLTKAGISVDLYETDSVAGGMAKTIALWGQKVDLGPHRFFSCDPRVNRLWLDVVGEDNGRVDRLTRIYYNGRFIHYPIKIWDVTTQLGWGESFRCLASYLKEKVVPSPAENTFTSWVTGRFGRRLFEIFFKTYTEKLWGISCQELESDFAAQRIRKLSFYEAVKNALFLGGRTQHKTLVDQFVYPQGGCGVPYVRMAEYVVRHGGRFLPETPISGVVRASNEVVGVELADGSIQRYDHVISTMPLNLLVERLDGTPDEIQTLARQLRFRNTVIVYFKVDGQDLFPDNWLYVHETALRTGRITNFRNWLPGILQGQRETILALEYWCSDTDAFWHWPDDEVIRLAKEELQCTGLTGHAPILDSHVHRVHRCYPVYARGYQEILNQLEHYLGALSGLTCIGRYGSFKYNNQDHSILMGILAAENVASGTNHNLWRVNSDDTYQESSILTNPPPRKAGSKYSPTQIG